MSDSDASSTASPGRCFCGNAVGYGDSDIYCSVGELRVTSWGLADETACARSDAFSSLCYKAGPSGPPSSYRDPLTKARAASASSSSSRASDASDASHYRRVERENVRREERKDVRRRRRAEASVASTVSRSTTVSSSASSRVPELVGGHSRNVSIASTSTSTSGWSGLSRNTSSASSASSSSRRYYGGNTLNVGAAIIEDDDEEEWLGNDKPYIIPAGKKHHRQGSIPRLGKKKLEPFGMGQDMRDVLEEIISMEKGFSLDDPDAMDPPLPGIFTATFDKPPRTPSPVVLDRRKSVVPGAPGAPARHRPQLSNPLGSPGLLSNRPPSLMTLHHSSLSESHTALYLATASPVSGRRSASPKLTARKSLTFSPDHAGPIIPQQGRFDSPASGSMNFTPSRRLINCTPQHHPAMDKWRFPAPGGTPSRSMSSDTPVKPRLQINTNAAQLRPHTTHSPKDLPRPSLLWPPPALGDSLFPSSPAGTPDVDATRRVPPRSTSEPDVVAPHSGMRLGVLLGSGEGSSEAMDVDDEVDGDDDSTAHGHGTYLPVFLEAEGFAGQ